MENNTDRATVDSWGRTGENKGEGAREEWRTSLGLQGCKGRGTESEEGPLRKVSSPGGCWRDKQHCSEVTHIAAPMALTRPGRWGLYGEKGK